MISNNNIKSLKFINGLFKKSVIKYLYSFNLYDLNVIKL